MIEYINISEEDYYKLSFVKKREKLYCIKFHDEKYGE